MVIGFSACNFASRSSLYSKVYKGGSGGDWELSRGAEMIGLVFSEKKQHSMRLRGMMTVPQDASTVVKPTDRS